MSVTDYERNPLPTKKDTDYTRNPKHAAGDSQDVRDEQEVWHTWLTRLDEAEKEREQYLPQIKVNRKFAAGKQWLSVNQRDGRVIDVRERNGMRVVTSDVLTRYLLTTLGRMAANDYRPNFLVIQDDEVSDNIAKQINAAFSWGWENEWMGDKKVLDLWRLLVIDGTAGIRCRYDRRFGDIAGNYPYRNGKPVFDNPHKYVADEAAAGRTAKIGTVREGKVVWELLTFDNILAPPGFDMPENFPWEIIARPVLIEDLKDRYGDKVKDYEEEDIESSGSLTAGLGLGEDKTHRLGGRVMAYTGYERANAKYPKGRTVLFTKQGFIEERKSLPYSSHPRGPSTGVHYFRWQVLPGRFPGKAFIENGLGGQMILNKRLTQIDTQIDRGLSKVFIEEQSMSRPKTGEPMEILEVRPGAPLPKVDQGVPVGGWMLQDVKLQKENVAEALGLSPVSFGQPPQGVTAYSALALLNENNALQFDPASQDFRLEMLEVAWDTMESMRNWPPNKQILIAGPANTLQSFQFNSNMIPPKYLVRPPRGGSLPRSQAAELQKIMDIWAASGGKLPLEWLVDSLNAGKAQDLPPSLGDAHAHKAELENIAMLSSLSSPPVAEYDDDVKHVEIHRAFQIPLQSQADQGDEKALIQVQVLQQHIEEHEASAKLEASNVGIPPTTGAGLPPQNLPTPGVSPGAQATPPLDIPPIAPV